MPSRDRDELVNLLDRNRQRQRQRAAARREAMVDCYRIGMPIEAIAEHFDVDPQTVRRGLQREGVIAGESIRRQMTEDEKDRARRMLEDGQSYSAVARTLGRSYETVRRNVPGFPLLSPHECGERAALVRQLNRIRP
jgi:transposase-like protein